MVFYCENCGARLEPDQKFCEMCGAPVAYDDCAFETDKPLDFDPMTVFTERNWQKTWRAAARSCDSGNLGIMLVNTKAFHGPGLLETVEKYIAFKRQEGIVYCLLDLANQKVGRTNFGCHDNVELLKKVYSCIKPKYLFIVGDHNVVGMIRWDNPAYMPPGLAVPGDIDKTVESDLPYVTLDVGMPFVGRNWKSYNFDGAVRVGRFPCGENSEYEFESYFKTVSVPKAEKPHPFALSALFWSETSKAIVSNFRDCKVHTCPEIGPNDLIGDGLKRLSGGDPNLLYFNLHGCSETNSWYGEDEYGSKPPAFAAQCLPVKSGYVIGTEACYGARFNSDSILNVALKQKGCLAFLGSHEIAYGMGDGQMSCADILVEKFMGDTARGATVGDAYISGLKALVQGDELNDAGFKTLCEFTLYGDPSEKPFGTITSGQKGIISFDTAIHIPMPDVRAMVRLKLAEVNEEIIKRVAAFVERSYGRYAEIKPTTCSVLGYGGYKAIYPKKKSNGIVDMLCVYFDDDGNVKKVLVTK